MSPERKEMRPYKVYVIEEGTVIDHIPPRKALKVVEMLDANDPGDSIVTIGINMDSKKHGKKDVVKIEKKVLTKEELDKVALVAPTATINIIKNCRVAKKWNVEIPDEVRKFAVCANPVCITRLQDIDSRFHIIDKKNVKVRCHYCERVFSSAEVLG